MKAFNLNMETTVFRFYFMMLIVIVAGFLHIWLLALLALPVLLSALLGVSFESGALAQQMKSRARTFESGIRKLRVPDHQTM